MRFGMGYDAWTGGRGGRGDCGPGRGRGPMEHGRGRRRLFDGGELRLVLLKLIADTPRHGYDLIREMETLTGGAYAPSPGVVYPTLTMLEDMGLIVEERSDGAKKMFAVTDAGRTHLTENVEVVEALTARLAEIGRHSAKTDGGPVRRAMGNLRTVLQNRLGQSDVDGDTLHQVSAIIDEAAQKIERLKA